MRDRRDLGRQEQGRPDLGPRELGRLDLGPRELGRQGEDRAVEYLVARGMVLVGRNWRCRHGEIDIVARDGKVLVFCEVKTRRGTGFGVPLAAITGPKLARMRRLAVLWLEEQGGHRGPIRIDAMGMLRQPDGRYEVEHIRGVS